jgi:putative transposase
MAVAAINDGRPNQAEVRRTIREELRQRWTTYSDACFVSTVVDEAVNNAFATLRKCAAKWKQGETCRLRFRSKRDVSQGFYVQKCGGDGQLLPRVLGTTYFSEAVPDGVAKQLIRVTRIRGRYFAAFRHTLVLSENQAGGRVVALDPGVRTFLTTFSNQEVCKYGDGLYEVINDLSNRIDGLISVRDRIVGSCQWMRQRRLNLQRSIWKLSNRIHDLVHDLHRRVAYDLVMRYDVILLPTFATSQMVSKNGRKIRRKTVRAMQRLRFHDFAQHVTWMCRKYGKTLVRVNESYTSKTDSRTGEVKQIGGAKSINGFDRDINGARGILLRALSRAT